MLTPQVLLVLDARTVAKITTLTNLSIDPLQSVGAAKPAGAGLLLRHPVWSCKFVYCPFTIAVLADGFLIKTFPRQVEPNQVGLNSSFLLELSSLMILILHSQEQ